MRLSDQIIESGPYATGQSIAWAAGVVGNSAEVNALRDELIFARASRRVLMDIVDPEPCRYDHHGYCQEHGWLEAGVCPHYRAKELL